MRERAERSPNAASEADPLDCPSQLNPRGNEPGRRGDQGTQAPGGAALARPARRASRDGLPSTNRLEEQIRKSEGTGNQPRTRNSGAAQRLGA